MYITNVEVSDRINGDYHNIFNQEYKVEILNNKFDIATNETQFSGYNLNSHSDKFESQPQEISFYLESKDVDTNIEFLQNEEMIFRIIKEDSSQFYFYATFVGKEINMYHNTGFVKVTFKLNQNTPFIKINSFDFEIDDSSVVTGQGYPIKYGYKYSGVSNSYDNSVFEVSQNGSFNSQVTFFITSNGNPQIFLENENSDNLNAYVSKDLQLSNRLVVSSFFPESGIYIIDNDNDPISNVQANRDFRYKSFLTFRKGSTKIFTKNISKLEVLIYELYPTF